MVRVGGGWDTLEHYLDKHDPCRCSSSGQCLWRGRGGDGQAGLCLWHCPSRATCCLTPAAHRLPQPRARTFSPQRVSPTPSPRAGSPAPGGERRSSRPELTPISLRASKEGTEPTLR